MRVLIIGTGYVGLNTGVMLAYLGNDVTCIDLNQEKVKRLQAGEPTIFEPHLDDLFAEVHPKMRFVGSYAEADIPNQDVVFIAVNTPSLIDGNADLSYVKLAAESIAEHLGEKFVVVVNKSTVPIGSGNWVEATIREHYQELHGSKPDGLFNVVSSPEFLAQGSALHGSFYPDRIVVGSEHEPSIERLKTLFRPIIHQDFVAPACLPRPAGLAEVPLFVCDLTSAEMIKYAANSFLALKISFINEVAHLAQKVGADVSAIAKGIGLDKRIGDRFLNAGIGWGGSCFGKDTAALVATAKDYNLDMPIIRSARDVNYAQRTWVVDRLQDELKILKGKHIALLGFSFKPNTDDLRDAPSLDISRILVQRGAIVRAHDPVALENARSQYPTLGISYTNTINETLQDADAIVLVTEWTAYREISWQDFPPVPVIDGRNFLDRERLTSLGFHVIGIGK